MKQQVVQRARELLEQGSIAGFLGLRQEGEQITPYLFTQAQELDQLSLGDREKPGDARYPLVKVLYGLAERFPGQTLGLMARGCDERALKRLIDEDRTCPIRPDRVVVVGFSCPEELAEACQCGKPWPDAMVAGEQTQGHPAQDPPGDPVFSLQRWFAESDHCMKCMGCRNVCPVCVCKECTVEEDALVGQRQLPPSPNFLLTRAMHMVDRCVYCGLCEQACPAGIPLKGLYRLVARLAGQGRRLPGAAPIVPKRKSA